MQEASPNQDRPDFIKYSVSGSTFLLYALKCLEYKTPNSILEFMDKQKFNCIIQNPPYELCEGIK